jgi:hypothetical protein
MGGGAAGGAFLTIVYLALFVVWYVGLWKVVEKANQPGWTGIVPILNLYVLVKISGKEWWWFLLMFVPCVNIVAIIVVSMAVAEQFGKSPGFGIGLALLPFIFYLMLGFGDAEYQGDAPPMF